MRLRTGAKVHVRRGGAPALRLLARYEPATVVRVTGRKVVVRLDRLPGIRYTFYKTTLTEVPDPALDGEEGQERPPDTLVSADHPEAVAEAAARAARDGRVETSQEVQMHLGDWVASNDPYALHAAIAILTRHVEPDAVSLQDLMADPRRADDLDDVTEPTRTWR